MTFTLQSLSWSLKIPYLPDFSVNKSHLKSNKIVMSASGVTRSPNGSIPDLIRCKTGSIPWSWIGDKFLVYSFELFFISILLIYYSTFKTSIVEAVVTWHIIPCIAMLGAKSVHAVFVFPIVWLAWSPKPKTTYFFVHPNVRSLHAAVI